MERIYERKRYKLHTDCPILGGTVWKLQFLQEGEWSTIRAGTIELCLGLTSNC